YQQHTVVGAFHHFFVNTQQRGQLLLVGGGLGHGRAGSCTPENAFSVAGLRQNAYRSAVDAIPGCAAVSPVISAAVATPPARPAVKRRRPAGGRRPRVYSCGSAALVVAHQNGVPTEWR